MIAAFVPWWTRRLYCWLFGHGLTVEQFHQDGNLHPWCTRCWKAT